MKPKPNKPMGALEAKEMCIADRAKFLDAIWEYMESKGYKWHRTDAIWVDDGSLEAEWADAENDKRKGN